MKFHYAETEVINPHAAHSPIVGKPTLTVTDGSETVTGTHDPQDNCTATVTAAPASSSQPPTYYFSRFDEANGKITASPYLPGTVDMKSAVSSGSSASCGQVFEDDSDDSADWTTAVHPSVTFPASRALPAKFPFPVAFHGTSSEPGLSQTVDVTATNTLEVSSAPCILPPVTTSADVAIGGALDGRSHAGSGA